MNFNATLIGQMITFGVFVWFCMKYIWPPLLAALEERNARIAEGLAAAQRGQQDLEDAEAKIKESFTEAKAQAQEIINQGREAAETAKDAIVKTGQEEARASVERAKREIGLETKKALDEIRRETVDLTIMAASQVIGRSLEDDDHRRLTSEVIEEMGVDRKG